MVTSEAVVLTLQRDGEIEGERGIKKEEKSADKAFCVRQLAALSFPTLTLLKASISHRHTLNRGKDNRLEQIL